MAVIAQGFAEIVSKTVQDGRELAESLMLDTCTITRPDPDAVRGDLDPSTGQYPPIARLTIYSGPCKIQDKSIIAGSQSSTVGERNVIAQGWELQLPVLTSGDVAVNDVAHIDSCLNDPSLIDREFTIQARHGASQKTARRLRVIEVTG